MTDSSSSESPDQNQKDTLIFTSTLLLPCVEEITPFQAGLVLECLNNLVQNGIPLFRVVRTEGEKRTTRLSEMEPPPENIGEFIRHVKMQPVTIIGFGVNDPCCGIPTPLPPIGITPDGRQILAKNSLPEGPKRPILVQMGGCIPQFIAVMSDGTEISAEEIFSFQKNEMRPVLVQKISPGPLLALQSLNQPIRLAIQNQ